MVHQELSQSGVQFLDLCERSDDGVLNNPALWLRGVLCVKTPNPPPLLGECVVHVGGVFSVATWM